jgi:hypothetical protein
MSRRQRLQRQLAIAALCTLAAAATASAAPSAAPMAWHTEPEARARHTEPQAPSLVPGDSGCTPASLADALPSAWHTRPKAPAAVVDRGDGTTCTDVPRHRKVGP